MSETNNKEMAVGTTRQHLSRVRMMSVEDRRRKAAEILATGLLLKMQAIPLDRADHSEASHEEG